MSDGKFPGICDKCNGRDVTMRSGPSWHPTGRRVPGFGRVTRVGDPGTEVTYSECHGCGHKWTWTPPPKVTGYGYNFPG